MKKLLVVVDMQNDFIDGSLGTDEAVAIVPKVVDKIKNWNGDVCVTQDTHYPNYLNTQEGQKLPIEHCIVDTNGHKINENVLNALCSHYAFTSLNKLTFGSTALPEVIRGMNYDYIEVIGLCTDICVISNVILLKSNYPEVEIVVDASCCAGVTLEKHRAALEVMKSCQITVINEGE